VIPNWGIFEATRRRAEELAEQRKPEPVKSSWAIGSMEWEAEQEKQATIGQVPDLTRQAAPLRQRKSSLVRLRAPRGIGSVYTFSGRTLAVQEDGTVEVSADDAQYLIRDGWSEFAEEDSAEDA